MMVAFEHTCLNNHRCLYASVGYAQWRLFLSGRLMPMAEASYDQLTTHGL